ncbi:MAG: hypothetical protein U0795_24775 [Pirellulales bacterium]
MSENRRFQLFVAAGISFLATWCLLVAYASWNWTRTASVVSAVSDLVLVGIVVHGLFFWQLAIPKKGLRILSAVALLSAALLCVTSYYYDLLFFAGLGGLGALLWGCSARFVTMHRAQRLYVIGNSVLFGVFAGILRFVGQLDLTANSPLRFHVGSVLRLGFVLALEMANHLANIFGGTVGWLLVATVFGLLIDALIGVGFAYAVLVVRRYIAQYTSTPKVRTNQPMHGSGEPERISNGKSIVAAP